MRMNLARIPVKQVDPCSGQKPYVKSNANNPLRFTAGSDNVFLHVSLMTCALLEATSMYSYMLSCALRLLQAVIKMHPYRFPYALRLLQAVMI